MYNRTIWQDHVEGVQEGTDMNAANFNNIEAGVMEANALAALNAEYRRYGTDVAKNNESVVIEETLEGAETEHTVAIPDKYTRNHNAYHVTAELLGATGGTAGDIIIKRGRQANGFSVKYTGTASSIEVRFLVTGGMI